MTTYSAVGGSEIGHKKPVTVSLLGKFRDNLLAVIEGDASAPRIQPVAIQGYTTPGAVGSIVFAGGSLTGVAVGASVAGSSLRPAGIQAGGSIGFDATALSGTWRCMGIIPSGGTADRATLWQRIA